MNEWDGLGWLIDVEPSFRLKKSHSFSILKALRSKKLNTTSNQKLVDINDKIVVQDSERSIHVGSFERSKILMPKTDHTLLFDNSNWTDRLQQQTNFDTFVLNETNHIEINKRIKPKKHEKSLNEIKEEYDKYFVAGVNVYE